MSEEPPGDILPEGYEIEPLPYIPPQQTPPAMETRSSKDTPSPVSSVVPSPPGSETIPAQKKSRRTFWLASGIIGVLLLIAATIVVIDINRSTPDKTLNTFCSALQGGDYHTAYDQFSQKLQGAISEAAFARIFAQDKVTGCTYSAINETESSATAGLELVHASRGMNRDGITLAKDEKNDWKIDDFYRQS
jgi:hypothetical protein